MDFAVVGEDALLNRLYPQLCANVAAARSIVGKEMEISAIDLRVQEDIAEIAGVKSGRPDAPLDDRLQSIYERVREEDAAVSISKLPGSIRSTPAVDLTLFDALVVMTHEQESPVATFWRDVAANTGPPIEYHLIADPPEPVSVTTTVAASV